MNGLLQREDVRRALRVYMARTGLSVGALAQRSGYSEQTVRQYISQACFGTAHDDGKTTQALSAWMGAHPAPRPEFPGERLYETQATRALDELLLHASRGGWGKVYGPAGAQKSFTLQFRAAQAAQEEEPRLALIEADTRMTPSVLLSRIGASIGAEYAQGTEGKREAALSILRGRTAPLGLVIDEAQILYDQVETLETLRRLGDRARGKLGILVCGNEEVLQLFEPRRRSYFEQWRSRIEQREVRVLGPSRAEARKMLDAELPGISERGAATCLDACTEHDPVGKKEYISVRRLFDNVRDFRTLRAKQVN